MKTDNVCIVGIQDDIVVIMRPGGEGKPLSPVRLSRDEALNLAAYIVTLTGSHEDILNLVAAIEAADDYLACDSHEVRGER